MKFLDFTDESFVIFFSVVVGCLLVALFLVVSLLILNEKFLNYEKKIKQESVTTRIFIIDVKKNEVTFFNRSSIRIKKKMDLGSFYALFHEKDSDKVKHWIFSICVNQKSADQYLEADTLFEKGKEAYFSLLKFLKYDPAVGVIHVECRVLKFIAPTNYTVKKKGPVYGIVKRSVMANAIKKGKSLRGFTFSIRFFYIRQKALSNEKVEKYMVMTLKNEVYPYASIAKEPRQIVDDSINELLLFDPHLVSRDEAMRLATSIAHSLRKSIGVNGYADSINFAIGVVENSQYYQDFDSIVQKAEQACINAQQNKKDVFMYQKSAGPLIQELQKYSFEVDRLMSEGNMRYLFRPIIDIPKHQILGYFEYVKAYDSPFTGFSEMSKYSAAVGKNRELFATVARNVIPKFASEKTSNDERLFFLVSMLDIDHMLEILPQIPQSREIRLVLVFDEQEVNENSSQLELLNNSLGRFRDLDYELALLLRDKNLLLDPSVYTNFDFFVAGANMLGEIKKNNRIRLSIHTLIEQLLRYNRPIIATDLEGWQSVELIIKSGISLISSETVAASNDMLLPVDRKKMDKLAQMDENFA